MWCDYGYSEEEEKPTEESIGLSLDEAKKLVKEKVEKMGITDLQFSNWNYAVCKSFEDDNSSGDFASSRDSPIDSSVGFSSSSEYP